MNRKKNWFVKFLCMNLSLCLAVPSMPFMQENAGYVYAAEAETQVQDADNAEEKVTQVSENEKDETQETKTQEEKMTQVSENTESVSSEVKETETAKSEPAEPVETTGTTEIVEPVETETAEEIETEPAETTEETETTESSEPVETETQLQTTETETDDSEYIDSLLQKLKEKYSGMYINDDGYFAYTDENGTVHTYDPYDPELYYNLLENDGTYEQGDSEFNQFNADSSDSTVSPFTKKTYIHEEHVSNKIVRHGIDVSKYQGDIDWEKAKKAGVYFAFVRVGYRGYGEEGKISGDEKAKDNIKKAHDAGVKVGVYFFSQAITESEATEEAKYTIKFLSDNDLKKYISMPVMIDYEYTAGDTKGRLEKANLSKRKHQDICDRFVKDVRGEGYDGGIYANYQMLTKDMQPTSSSVYSKTHYWIARYSERTKYIFSNRCHLKI